jgi:hypothetical protein
MRCATACCLLALVLCSGCARLPKPQRGGGSLATLGGASAPTLVATQAPENPQTPTTTTIRKTMTRDFATPAGTTARPETDAAGLQAPTGHVTGAEAATSAPIAAAAGVAPSPQLIRETVAEESTTQIGTSQELTGILKAWGAATAGRAKALLWALGLALTAWLAWRREWPLMAALLAAGALLSLLLAWWAGPLAAGAATLVWAAWHVAHAQGLPLSTARR